MRKIVLILLALFVSAPLFADAGRINQHERPAQEEYENLYNAMRNLNPHSIWLQSGATAYFNDDKDIMIWGDSNSLNLVGDVEASTMTVSSITATNMHIIGDLTVSGDVSGSTFDQFVDTTTNQTVGGEKSFTEDLFITSGKKFYFHGSSETYIYQHSDGRTYYVVNDGTVTSMSGSQIITRNGTTANPSYSFIGDENTGIDYNTSGGFNIVSNNSVIFQFATSGFLCNANIRQTSSSGGALDIGSSANWFLNVYAADYPVVSRKSLKENIEKIDKAEITDIVYQNLPEMAKFEFKGSTTTRLGFLLNDDNEEEFGDYLYTYINNEGENEASLQSLLATCFELIRNLNNRVKILEQK